MKPKYNPTLSEVRELAGAGNLIAVHRELPADLETPVSVYMKLRAGQQGPSFLLESVEKGEQLGRYSFIGVHAPMTAVAYGDRTVIGGAGGTTLEIHSGDPLTLIRDLMADRQSGSTPRTAALHRWRSRIFRLRPGAFHGASS